MSVEPATLLSRIADASLQLGAKHHPDRRRRPRRAVDQQQTRLAELAKWLVNRNPQPLFLLDTRFKVLLINEAARRFVNRTKAIMVENNRLTFRNDRYHETIARLKEGDSESVSLALRFSGSSATLSVSKLLMDDASGLIFIAINSYFETERSYELLRTEFGLTRAEAEIATSIFNGFSLVAISKRRGASINTVKTQVRYIFQKCRVQSQLGLIRRMAPRLTANL